MGLSQKGFFEKFFFKFLPDSRLLAAGRLSRE